MIDKRPVDGDVTSDWWLDTESNSSAPMLTEQTPHRVSQVLGPDGNPVLITEPRRVIGFDLSYGVVKHKP